jgi:hypothetical protein
LPTGSYPRPSPTSAIPEPPSKLEYFNCAGALELVVSKAATKDVIGTVSPSNIIPLLLFDAWHLLVLVGNVLTNVVFNGDADVVSPVK